MKIVHVIPELARGGAERVLCRIVENKPSPEFEHRVICLKRRGEMADCLEKRGVVVSEVGFTSVFNFPFAFFKLIRQLRQAGPDLVQTWMYHADFFGGLASKFAGAPPLIWSIRQSNFPPGGLRFSTRVAAWFSARLSGRVPDLIVANSEAGRRFHEELGYDAEKMTVVPNGIDTDKFKPDPEARVEVREELGLAEDTPLVGLYGRFHPQKDHETFIRAAAFVKKQRSAVHFVLCGREVTADNEKLAKWIEEGGLADNIHLLGERNDMPRLQAALDLAVSSSSFAEGMSNTILEAMACGVPCVVTDIGDNPTLVGDEYVASPERPRKLAEKIGQVLQRSEEERNIIGKENRGRIEDNYSLDKMVANFHELYKRMGDDR